jgi:DNA-binding response OmpR family regulator
LESEVNMYSPLTVLIVDDERAFAEGLQANLEREGWKVILARDGEEALRSFSREPIDLVLLDLMLPGIDGMEVCNKLRSSSTIPIIMLTAKDDDIDKILGLEVGADDYLTKPFNFRELLARMRAIMRRIRREGAEIEDKERYTRVTDTVRLDTRKQTLLAQDGSEQPLTVKELALMELLARYPERVFTREELLDRVWGYDYYGSSRTVDVHVRRLRQKLESFTEIADGSQVIRTRWGAGYFLAGVRKEKQP